MSVGRVRQSWRPDLEGPRNTTGGRTEEQGDGTGGRAMGIGSLVSPGTFRTHLLREGDDSWGGVGEQGVSVAISEMSEGPERREG